MSRNWLPKLKEEIIKQALRATRFPGCPEEMKFVCARDMEPLMMEAAHEHSEDISLDWPSRVTESGTRLSRVRVRQQPGAAELRQLAFQRCTELVSVSWLFFPCRV